MTDWIYDLETYPNIFSIGLLNVDTKEAWVFEISTRKNQSKQMIDFMRRLYREKARMVGFNNIGFDYPVLHYILKNKDCSVYSIYKKAMSLINADHDDRFKNLVKEEDVMIPQIDLFKIHHFDNKARATSLKVLEFNMRSDNIEDLPFDVGMDLSSSQMDTLIKYMQHDIKETYKFYLKTIPMISFREELSKKYNKNFLNHNDTKIGKDYLIMRLEETNPGCCYKIDPHGRRKIQQTKRKNIKLKECIFPYISFERDEFKAVLEWFKSQTIKETKGVFTDILEHNLGAVAQYAEMVIKEKKLKGEPTAEEIADMKKELPLCWVEERILKSSKKPVYYKRWRLAENLNVVVDGFRFDFGTGGIHGSLTGVVAVETEQYQIIDADVSSMYPNLAISNGIYPEHLGQTFCTIYKEMYLQRKSYDKKSAENAMLKLALNGTYGDSNSEFSPLYDPKFTMSITVNGQLSLCMLAERLLKIEGLKLIQVNTDGITVYMPRSKKEQYDAICDQWQKEVKLDLEYADYSKMCVRDVNNYTAIYTDGKVKNKGAYEYKDLGWHKNHSALVIAMAVDEHITKGVDVEEFICNHDNILDFMLRVKVPRSNKLFTVDEFGVEIKEQNICRYYVSTNGRKLVKVMPALDKPGKIAKVWKNELGDEMLTFKDSEDRKASKVGFNIYSGEREIPQEERPQEIEAGRLVTICNDVKKFSGNIDFDYYVSEAKKLIDCFTTTMEIPLDTTQNI
jgi:hypothetical protein